MPKGAILAAELLAVAFLAIQLVPIERSNPPVETEVPASPEARSVLQRACYDCHSNEVVWFYVSLHPAAELSDEDRRILDPWSRLPPRAARDAAAERAARAVARSLRALISA